MAKGSTTDRKAQRAQERYEARQEAARRAQLRFVMSTTEGRAFIFDLIFHRLGLHDTYPGQDSGIYRHEGKREAAVKLGHELQTECTSEYLLMITERMEWVKTDKAFRDRLAHDGDADVDS